MISRPLLAFLALPALLVVPLLLASACRTDRPDRPEPSDGWMLAGSDWIPGRSISSFETEGEPFLIENVGQHELRIGRGPHTPVLAPGAFHETDGSETEVYNPAGDEGRVMIHVPDAAGSSTGVDVHVKHRGEHRTIRATYRAGATKDPR